MKFGLSFASQPAMVAVAVEAERLGYDSVGFYDTPLVCSDPFVVAGLVASQTHRIQIGISVAIPYLRLPHVLATAVGTLNQIAPKRITLGFGTGYTGALTTGNRPDTWSTVREQVRVCRGLLAGEEVETTIKGQVRRIAHLHPDSGFINRHDQVPIFISALGPKGMEVAAEIADGLYTIVGGRRPTGADLAPVITRLRDRAAQFGKPHMPVMLVTAMAVRDPDEAVDSDRLRHFQGPWVTSHLHGDLGSSYEDPATPRPIREASRSYANIARSMRSDAPWLQNHRGHSIFVRPEEEELLNSEVLSAMCQIGTADTLLNEIRELEEAGVNEVIWQCVPGFEAEVERFAREIIQPYRSVHA